MGNLTAPLYTPLMQGGAIPSLVGGNIDASSIYYPGSMVFYNPATQKFMPTPAAGYVCVGVLDSDAGTILGTSVTGTQGFQTWIQKIRQGVAKFAAGTGADAIPATTPPGTILYAIDNQTVGIDSAGGTRVPAGKLWYVDGASIPGYDGQAGVWLEIRWTNFTQNPATTPPSGIAACRNVVTTNIASLASYTVASASTNDNVLNVAGDRIWLANQTTKSQNGPYIVGTVTTGTAPLTRPTDFLGGNLIPDQSIVQITAGTLFAGSTWKITTAGGITVDTTAFDSYPGRVTQSVSLGGGTPLGTATIANVPVLSATKTGFAITRTTATTSTLTVGGYAVVGAITPGIAGTGSFAVDACVGAGTINTADGSTLAVTVINF